MKIRVSYVVDLDEQEVDELLQYAADWPIANGLGTKDTLAALFEQEGRHVVELASEHAEVWALEDAQLRGGAL